MNEYVSTKNARKILGVTTQTLRNWDITGKINTIRSASGARLYNKQDINHLVGIDLLPKKKKIAYCRVSSRKQKDDLERQKDFFRHEYPDYDLVTDIASGINWKRKGIETILESAMRGELEEIVVAHKDRLCRFGFELLEWILTKCKVKINILDKGEQKSISEELADDIISIIHVFSCKQMGRRYTIKNEKNSDISESDADTNV